MSQIMGLPADAVLQPVGYNSPITSEAYTEVYSDGFEAGYAKGYEAGLRAAIVSDSANKGRT